MTRSSISFLVVCWVFLTLTGCGDKGSCPGDIHIPYWVDPVQGIYQVGDTVQFFSKFSKILSDTRGNEFHFLDNEWNLNFSISPLDTDSVTYYTKLKCTSDYLDVLNVSSFGIEHIILTNSDSYNGTYICDTDSCFFRIIGILTKPGIITSNIGVGTSAPNDASGCELGWLNAPPFVVSMNNGQNHNLFLLDELDNWARHIVERDAMSFNRKGGYLMKVVH